MGMRSDNGTIKAEIAIIGGGIAGVALAHYLAEEGCSDVVVLESNVLGSGSTGGSFGGVRQQFSTRLEIELAKRGLEFWRTLESRFDSACPFHADGYLLLTGRQVVADALERAVVLQRDMGAPDVHLLAPNQLPGLFPWLRPDGLLVGSWSPNDGYVTATDGLQALRRSASKRGVSFIEQHPVHSIRKQSRWFVLDGPRNVRAETVIVAANYDSPQLVAPFGIQLDIQRVEIYSAITGPALPGQTVPLTLELDGGIFVMREGLGLNLGYVMESDSGLIGPTEMLYSFAEAARARAPSLVGLPIVKTVKAVEETGGDGHPYVGQINDGLWVIAGFGGHGVTHGPPAAQALAREISGRRDASLDLSSLSPWRKTNPDAKAEWLVLVKKTGGLTNG
jgi:sarcosine oxidase subunit beta